SFSVGCNEVSDPNADPIRVGSGERIDGDEVSDPNADPIRVGNGKRIEADQVSDQNADLIRVGNACRSCDGISDPNADPIRVANDNSIGEFSRPVEHHSPEASEAGAERSGAVEQNSPEASEEKIYPVTSAPPRDCPPEETGGVAAKRIGIGPVFPSLVCAYNFTDSRVR